MQEDDIQSRRLRLAARCEYQRSMLKIEAAPLLHDADTVDYWFHQFKRYRRMIIATVTISTILGTSRRGGLLRRMRFILPAVAPFLVKALRKRLGNDADPESGAASQTGGVITYVDRSPRLDRSTRVAK